MKHLLFTLAIALLLGNSASAQTGRTDGAEGKRIWQRGIPFWWPEPSRLSQHRLWLWLFQLDGRQQNAHGFSLRG